MDKESIETGVHEIKKRASATETEMQETRKRGKGNPQAYKNSQLGDKMYKFKDGEISQLMRQAIEINSWPPIDLDDDEAVDERINEYWMYCAERDARPMVSGLALSLGISRQALNDWKNGRRRGKLSTSRADLIKKAYSILEFMWEQYMTTGKINPASGCFIGKNNFGYQDEIKITAAPAKDLEPERTPEEIEKKLEQDIPIDVDYEEI